MIGIEVTRDVALRVLTAMEREISDAIQAAARDGTVPRTPGAFRLWVDRHEERLATLEAMRALVDKLPLGAVLKKAEAEAQ